MLNLVAIRMGKRITAEKVPAPSESEMKTVTDTEQINDVYALYLDDESHSFDGETERLIFPTTEAQVADELRKAYENGTPLTIQGGRTGLTGAAVPLGGTTLNFEEMDKILYMNYYPDEDHYSITAEPGVLLEDLVKAITSKNLDELKGKGDSPNQEALERFLNDDREISFLVDPTETSAWLGGIVACNASGARTFKYGAVRDWVKRIRVLLPNGDALDIRRGEVFAEDGVFEIELSDDSVVKVKIPDYEMPRTKNAAGLYAKPDMDLIDLFIGCEGILGAITEVELILAELPPNIMTVMAFFPSEEQAVDFVYEMREPDCAVPPEFIEYFGPYALDMIRQKAGDASIKVPALTEEIKAVVFFEFAYAEEEMEEKVMALEEILNKHGSSSESSWAGLDYRELEKMKTVRHFVPESVNSMIAMRKARYEKVHKIGTDMAVPDEALREYLAFYREVLEEQGMEYVIFGHIGDNHLHVNMIPRNNEEVEQGMENYRLFAERAVELGGTVAAEHGIGKLKRQFLEIMYGEEGISEMQAVKKALDPKWLLNQGNMVSIPE
ncbi:MAG: FAD-binding protein [Candidatus Lokiarchaeota archaeon]|nr:FAD-binding protein [Candidatus Lokiarchaeota archaeon]